MSARLRRKLQAKQKLTEERSGQVHERVRNLFETWTQWEEVSQALTVPVGGILLVAGMIMAITALTKIVVIPNPREKSVLITSGVSRLVHHLIHGQTALGVLRVSMMTRSRRDHSVVIRFCVLMGSDGRPRRHQPSAQRAHERLS